MKTISIHKIDAYRRLCILKDLKELEFWIYTLESFNGELDHFNTIEKQLIKNSSVSNAIQAIRRKNILMMATLCKYEQELKKEYEYGKTEYNIARSKLHENKREQYVLIIQEHSTFKKYIYKLLMRYKTK